MPHRLFLEDPGKYTIGFDFTLRLEHGEYVVEARATCEESASIIHHIVTASTSEMVHIVIDTRSSEPGDYIVVIEVDTNHGSVIADRCTVHFRPGRERELMGEYVRHYSSNMGVKRLNGEWPLNKPLKEVEEVEQIRVIRFKGVIK